jgi:hypothetical protein
MTSQRFITTPSTDEAKRDPHPFIPSGVAQWTSYQPQRPQTRVRIPPGYKGFRKNISMLFCIFALICIACVLEKRNKGIRPKIFFNSETFTHRSNQAA